MHYCSSECRKADWYSGHKHECRIFGESKDDETRVHALSDSETRLLLRYLQKINRHKSKTKFLLYDARYRRLSDLMDHADEFRQRHNGNVLQQLTKKFRNSGLDATKDELLHLHGQLSINSWAINDSITNEALGIGLYVEVSVFDHSCRPNVAHVFNGTQIQFRAIRSIAEGEPIFVSYTQLFDPKPSRQEFLFRNYFFECNCDRCKHETQDDQWCIQEVSQKIRDAASPPINHEELNIWLEMKIAMLKEQCSHYHPEITLALKDMFFTLDYESQDSRSAEVVNQFLHHAAITHGVHHPLYKAVQQQVRADCFTHTRCDMKG